MHGLPIFVPDLATHTYRCPVEDCPAYVDIEVAKGWLGVEE